MEREEIGGKKEAAPANVRRIAASVLAEKSGFADARVNAACERWELGVRERRNLTRLVFETIRRRALLDAVLVAYSHKAPESLAPGLREPLRIAVFELLHSRASPAWAVVDEAVESVKAIAGRRESRFANAVLRKLTRGMRFLEDGEEARENKRTLLFEKGPPLRFDRRVFPGASRVGMNLATRHSHPEFLVEAWRGIFGDEGTRRVLGENNRPPRLSLRLRAREEDRCAGEAQLQNEGWESEPGRFEDVRFVTRRGHPATPVSFGHGAWIAQDETATGPVRALTVGAGCRVLDLCAAPGGKTVQVADRMEGGGLVVSADLFRARLALAVETVGRTGASAVAFVLADGTRPPFRRGAFDAVLVDAPCSNTGVARRRPEARWRIRPGTVAERSGLQRRLLAEGARCVRPGGRVVYSTCSIDPGENQEVVSDFLARNGGFRLLAEESVLPGRADGGYWAVILREGP